MESKIFKNVIVGTRKPKTTIQESSTDFDSGHFCVSDSEVISFFHSIPKLPRVTVCEKLPHYLAEINPNKMGNYLPIISKHMHDVTILKMLPFFNLESLVVLAQALKLQETRLTARLLESIDAEVKLRTSNYYTKIMLLKSSYKSMSDPYKNVLIHYIYSSLLTRGVSETNNMEILNNLEMLSDNLLPEEKYVCQQNIDIIIIGLVKLFEDISITMGPNKSKDNLKELNQFAECFNKLFNSISRESFTKDKKIIAINTGLLIQYSIEDLETKEFVRFILLELQKSPINIDSLLENVNIPLMDEEDIIDEVETDFSDEFVDFLYEEDDEKALETFDHMLRLAYIYESKVADKTVKGLNKTKRGAEKVAKGMRNTAKDVKRVDKAAKEIPKVFTDLVNGTYKKLKAMDAEKRRNAVLEDKSLTTRLFRMIRFGFKLALSRHAFSVLGPVNGAIAILVGFYFDGQLNNKAKKKVVEELELELKIVRKKLEDSKGDGDKKAKYELMCLEAELEKNLKKIRGFRG